jgi:Malectin domain/Fibronectin type III domain/PQQ-like domain
MDSNRAGRAVIVVLALAGILLGGRWALFSHSRSAKAATTSDWLQFSFDEEKTGFNPNETTISTSNVSSLKQIFSITASGKVDGAPVLLTGVSTASGIRDLLFFSTFGGELYAVDAHTGTTVWTQTVTCSGCQSNSSPAIDPNRQFVYMLGLDGFIHKYQVGDGTEIKTGGWPANVLGSNSTKSHAALAFATAANGNTYLYGSGGSFDIHGQGHVTAINLADGSENTFNFMCSNVVGIIGTNGLTCSSTGAGIWSRGGFAYHPGTNLLYTETAEWGTFAPTTKWSQSALAVPADGSHTGAPANGSVVDSYTPTNWAAEISADHDLGSTNPIAMPDMPGAAGGKHYVMVNAKDSILRILDASDMSGQGGPGHTGGGAFTMSLTGIGEIFSSCAVWTNPSDGSVWIIATGTTGYAGLTYSLDSNGIPTVSEVWSHSSSFVSSAVVANGVAYFGTGGGLNPSSTNRFLMAVDIKTGATLWSGPGGSGSAHWSSPIVVNGMVYMSNAGSPSTITAYGLGTVVSGPPATPTGLTATAGNTQVSLSWTASSGATSYNVQRSTTSGGPYTTVSSPTTNSYNDTGLTNGTTYYYVVSAANSNGTSGNSTEVSATPAAVTSVEINSGSTTAVSPFVADEDFSGGATIDHANTIDTSKVTNPAPEAVYQTARVAATAGADTTFSYTIPGFVPGSSQMLRLHFAETFWTAAGKRQFNVSINGTQVLTNFDIFATAGGENIANIQQFTEPANASGEYVLVFSSDIDKALISGIEIDPAASCSAPTAPSGLTATATSSSQINLSWTASTSSCGLTYDVFRSTTSGFTPSSSNEIANGVSASTYSDTGLAASTIYYYLVEGSNSGGTSAASNQASATTLITSGSCTSLCINSGGPAVSPFVADEDFAGGATIDHANTINTSKVTNPAPAAVYQSARVTTAVGPGTTYTYTIGGFTANSSHTVRLHFCETFWTAAGKRLFNVSINGTQVLTNFDIFATAGGQNIANIQQFTETADSTGTYTLVFTSNTDKALISGIEID